MRQLRLRVGCDDERALAAQLGADVAAGGIVLRPAERLLDNEAVRFEMVSPHGEVLFSGEGIAVRTEEDAGVVVRYRKLTGPERAVLDRLLLHRDGVGDLGLPRPLPDSLAVDSTRRSVDGFPAVLALDIGGTLARAALLMDERPKLVTLGTTGATSMPAAVALDEKGRLLLGQRARAQSGLDPASSIGSPMALIAIDPDSAKDAAVIERLPFPIRDDETLGPIADLPTRSAPATELLAAVAHELRDRAQTLAGRTLTEAHLVCSSIHHPRVRLLLQAALHRAGFGKVVLLDGAVCIAASYGFSATAPPPGPILVVDWGGSLLNLAVLGDVNRRLDVLAAGEKHGLGGGAIDERLARTLMDQLEHELGERCTDPLARQRVLEAAETARVTLATQPQAHVRLPWVATTSAGRPVDLEATLEAGPVLRQLEPALDQVMRAALAVLESVGVEPSGVHQVLLAGGQCSWASVQQRFERRFPGKVHRIADPGSLAVLGAARLGMARATKPSGPRRLALPISVLTADGSLLPLFEARTPLPAQSTVRVRAEGAGVYCPLIEGDQVGEGYLGAGRLPGAVGEVEVAAGIDAQGLLDLHLGDADHESTVRLSLRGADAGLEATSYAQRSLPGEPDVWSRLKPKPVEPRQALPRPSVAGIRLPPRAPQVPGPPPRKR